MTSGWNGKDVMEDVVYELKQNIFETFLIGCLISGGR